MPEAKLIHSVDAVLTCHQSLQARCLPDSTTFTSSSWIQMGSTVSYVSNRNHCRSDPVQVQSTMRKSAAGCVHSTLITVVCPQTCTTLEAYKDTCICAHVHTHLLCTTCAGLTSLVVSDCDFSSACLISFQTMASCQRSFKLWLIQSRDSSECVGFMGRVSSVCCERCDGSVSYVKRVLVG